MLVLFATFSGCREHCGISKGARAMAGPDAVDCGSATVDADAAWSCATSAYLSGAPFFLTQSGSTGDTGAHSALAYDGSRMVFLNLFVDECPSFNTTPCAFIVVRPASEWVPNVLYSSRPEHSDWIHCASEDPLDSGYIP